MKTRALPAALLALLAAALLPSPAFASHPDVCPDVAPHTIVYTADLAATGYGRCVTVGAVATVAVVNLGHDARDPLSATDAGDCFHARRDLGRLLRPGESLALELRWDAVEERLHVRLVAEGAAGPERACAGAHHVVDGVPVLHIMDALHMSQMDARVRIAG